MHVSNLDVEKTEYINGVDLPVKVVAVQEAVARQHARGELTLRERLDALLDPTHYLGDAGPAVDRVLAEHARRHP
jgi:acetyl-CoA carboxylase carboxyltransferase component